MNHDNDETLQRVEDSEEDLEEGGATVCDGQDSRHPGEGQERQNHAGAPQRRPAGPEDSTSDAIVSRRLHILLLLLFDCKA